MFRRRICKVRALFRPLASQVGGRDSHYQIFEVHQMPTDSSTELSTVTRSDFDRLAYAVRGMKAMLKDKGMPDLEAEERALWHVAGQVAQHPAWHWLPIGDMKLMLQGALRQLERSLKPRSEAGQVETSARPTSRPAAPSGRQGRPRRRGGWS